MLSVIKDIGKLAFKRVFDNEKKIEGKVLAILLDIDKQAYLGIEIEDFDFDKISRYLYKQGGSRGTVPSPFCPLTEPLKTYKKIERWIKQCNDINDNALKPHIQLINETLNVYRETIISDIIQKTKDLKRKESKFLTLRFNGKYLGEFEFFRKCLTCFEERRRMKSTSSAVCSICGISGKEVSGKTNIFRFYSTDKPGFITGGFEEINAWKNYPVCKDCNDALDAGKKRLQNNRYKLCSGIYYYLIPKLIINSSPDYAEIVDIIYDSRKRLSLKERITKKITNDNEEILSILSQNKDFLTVNFIFLKGALGGSRDAEKIELLIEDVFPSMIKKIFESKDYVDRIFNNDSEKSFTFGTIRTFFSKSDEAKRKSDLNKYFYEIIDSVFKGRKLDFAFLAKFYMAVIRKEFINDRYFSFRMKDALMSTIFFEDLGLIIFEEVKNMEESLFGNIFVRYGKSFGSSAKRGIFLLGALTQLLLNKQWSERNAKPFMKKLKSLKMDESDIKALLPEVQNKLEEYEAFDKGKRLVASETAKYLLAAGDAWKMSVDEINYYFACGMNLTDDIAAIVYQKEENH